jgi:hypothetical protein
MSVSWIIPSHQATSRHHLLFNQGLPLLNSLEHRQGLECRNNPKSNVILGISSIACAFNARYFGRSQAWPDTYKNCIMIATRN